MGLQARLGSAKPCRARSAPLNLLCSPDRPPVRPELGNCAALVKPWYSVAESHRVSRVASYSVPWAAGAGFALTLVFSIALGAMIGVDPTTPELASRTTVGIWDLALALAAGCAGALAFTSGAPTYLTGVMVAVALLPPTVASGMLISAGEWNGAGAALLLAAGNITSVTLAAILTFAARGMRPRNWWLEERAQRSARVGIAVFVALLAALAGIIFLASGR